MKNEPILFEHPATEHTRICLQLEQRFDELQNYIDHDKPFDKAAALQILLHIIRITERPDLKSKLTQSLTQHATTLAQLEKLPQIDPAKLGNVLHELDKQITLLHNMQHKIGEPLQKNEFLKQICLQVNNPGGLSYFKSPAYWRWLNLTDKACLSNIKDWQREIEQLKTTSKLVLNLLRDSAEIETIHTEAGFYHQSLNPALPCQLVRVFLPNNINAYPEFSVGRHRLSIRLLTPEFNNGTRASTITEDTPLQIACCRL